MKRLIVVLLAALSLPVLAINPAFLGSFKKPISGGGGGGCTPSYANTGGTGNRTNIITITCGSDFGSFIVGTISELVNGVFISDGPSFSNFTLDPSFHEFVRFDFGSAATISEAKFYQSTTADQGVWQWQGSNDASTWTTIGATFSLVTGTTTTLTTLSGNTTAYRYYQMVGISGSTQNGSALEEMEFKICPGL